MTFNPKVLTRIPVIRPTMAELAAAEAEVIATVKALHGEQHEPSAVWTREAALRLLADKTSTASVTVQSGEGE